MNSNKVHKNGRPSKTEQLRIQREIMPYFEHGVSAHVAAQKSGINVKTVCKYYNDLAEGINESEENDFLERQKKQRAQIIVSYDNQILDANKHFDDINDQINRLKKEQKPIPLHLFSLRLDAMKYRSYLTEKKGAFLMQPTIDEALEKKIDEKIRKHGNPRPSN